jgi:hypothetical protein
VERKKLIYLALVHYPVLNRHGNLITSAITNLDIHDIARLARTYELSAFYLVTPLLEQQALAKNLINHWLEGAGGEINPDRREAMSLIKITEDIEKVCHEITCETGGRVLVYATTAKKWPNYLEWQVLRKKIEDPNTENILLLFGTASGFNNSLLKIVDGVLYPIEGNRKYNHLSVRSAVAITLDRLLGNRN